VRKSAGLWSRDGASFEALRQEFQHQLELFLGALGNLGDDVDLSYQPTGAGDLIALDVVGGRQDVLQGYVRIVELAGIRCSGPRTS
jgi:hypothetical protein